MTVAKTESSTRSKKKFNIKDLFKPMPYQNLLPHFSGNPLHEGVIKTVWGIIISYLTPYELLLSRFWSKAFRDLHLQPMTIILRQIVRGLGYDIKFSDLDAMTFKIQADEEYSLQKMKGLIHLLETLRFNYEGAGSATETMSELFDFIGMNRKISIFRRFILCSSVL